MSSPELYLSFNEIFFYFTRAATGGGVPFGLAEDFGHARRVVAGKDDTTIIEGRGTEEAIQDRISQLKAQMAETTSDYDREKLQERIGKLAGGVAVIRVGAATEVELKN